MVRPEVVRCSKAAMDRFSLSRANPAGPASLAALSEFWDGLRQHPWARWKKRRRDPTLALGSLAAGGAALDTEANDLPKESSIQAACTVAQAHCTTSNGSSADL